VGEMNKQDPKTKKPENRPPSQFKKNQVVRTRVVVKITDQEPFKKFIEAVAYSINKVEDGDISKETAYNRIVRAVDEMREKIKEQSDGSSEQ
jgi:hypothetical protein